MGAYTKKNPHFISNDFALSDSLSVDIGHRRSRTPPLQPTISFFSSSRCCYSLAGTQQFCFTAAHVLKSLAPQLTAARFPKLSNHTPPLIITNYVTTRSMTFYNYLIRESYNSITSNPVEKLEEILKIKFRKH
jgi:hypothetical protein